jgi:hypothetical protein
MTSSFVDNLLRLLRQNAELKKDLRLFYWTEAVIQPFYKQCLEIIESGNPEEIQTLQNMITTLHEENEKLGKELSFRHI